MSLQEGEREWHHIEVQMPEAVKAGEIFEIKVRVGKGSLHPSTLHHYIAWVKALFKPEVGPVQQVATFLLGPSVAEPSFSFSARFDREGWLHFICYCNVHGLFSSRVRVVLSRD